jgi:hypothetical protein
MAMMAITTSNSINVKARIIAARGQSSLSTTRVRIKRRSRLMAFRMEATVSRTQVHCQAKKRQTQVSQAPELSNSFIVRKLSREFDEWSESPHGSLPVH